MQGTTSSQPVPGGPGSPSPTCTNPASLPGMPQEIIERIGEHMQMPDRSVSSKEQAAQALPPPPALVNLAAGRTVACRRCGVPPLPLFPACLAASCALSPGTLCRVNMTSCCAALLSRPEILGSTKLWGDLVVPWDQLERADQQASFAAWLRRHNAGLRRLRLDHCEMGYMSVDPAETLQALAGSPLEELIFDGNPLIGTGDHGAMLSALGQLSALTSLTFLDCSLDCLPPQLPALTRLAALSIVESERLPEDWAPSLGTGSRNALRAKCAGFEHLTALIRLQLSELDLPAIPPQVSALVQLEMLNVNRNKALGSQPGSLSCLAHLPRLTQLSLTGCGVQGTPP